MRVAYKISLLTVSTALLVTAILTALSYSSARKQYYAGIDQQLTAAAAALPRVLGEGYLSDALGPAGIDEARYVATVKSLSQLADDSSVYYLYAFAERDGKFVHLTTSASPQEREQGDWSSFLEPYDARTPALAQTFNDGQTRFAEYTDAFGAFRSIFVRQTTSAGQSYLVGVDISLDQIHRHLRNLVIRDIATGLVVALLAGAVGIVLSRRIARPINELNSEVEAWARRDFAKDESIRARLVSLSARQRDEAGELARRFVDVQDKLETYLVELTRATAEKQKIENQLEIAKSIQESLLPDKMPNVEHFEIVGWSKPADQTGGDYFDWIALPDGKIMLTIADVTGHGIGPALVTAASRAYARATFNSANELEATVERLNDLLHSDLKGERFVTLIACLLDPALRKMQLLAAGHGPILYYSKQRDSVRVTEDTHGVPLGAFDGFKYDKPTLLRFEPGDVLVLVSDGFYDWMNTQNDFFGTDRLRESVLRSCRTDPTQIIPRLREDIAAFNGGRSQHDDTTALVIRCTA